MKSAKHLLLILLYSYTLPLSVLAVSGDVAQLSDLDSVFSTVVSVILTLVGIGAVVMLIVGGYQYLMAGGNKDAAARASHTLTYAIIGLIVAMSAWLILSLVGGFLGVDLSSFSVCFPGTSGCP